MVVSAVLFFRLYEVALVLTVIKHLLCLLSYHPQPRKVNFFLVTVILLRFMPNMAPPAWSLECFLFTLELA